MVFTASRQTSGALKTDVHKDQRRSERRVLSEKMIQFVLLHFRGLDAPSLHDYTFERYKTDYPNAKAEVDIFDAVGKLVFQGREFNSGMAGYWRPSRVSMMPEWTSNEKTWGRQPAGRLPE